MFLVACWGISCQGLALPLLAWCRAVSREPGPAVMVAMNACVVTCGRSFTVSSVWGVLISFLECFSVFSHPPLPFLLFLHYYYCLYCFYFFSLLLLLLFPQSSWLCVTGAWAGAGCGGLGLLAGLRVGLALGCSCYLGLGSAAPAPRFLGTQPPYAMQVLTVGYTSVVWSIFLQVWAECTKNNHTQERAN